MTSTFSYQIRILERDPSIPTVYGRIEAPHFVFYCPFCGVEHKHGYSSPEDLCHRAAHCKNPESPFIETGYYLELLRNRPFS